MSKTGRIKAGKTYSPEKRAACDMARLLQKTVKSDGCWTWTGASRNGYGKLHFRGRMQEAHRVSYTLHVGEVPDGLHIDHLCRNRGCVNPAHLEPVTQFENNMRCDCASTRNARKTHCKRGHEFTKENTRLQKFGKSKSWTMRICKACAREDAAANRRSEGTPARNRDHRPSRDKLASDIADRLSWAAIGRKYGVCGSTAKYWASDAGVAYTARSGHGHNLRSKTQDTDKSEPWSAASASPVSRMLSTSPELQSVPAVRTSNDTGVFDVAGAVSV